MVWVGKDFKDNLVPTSGTPGSTTSKPEKNLNIDIFPLNCSKSAIPWLHKMSPEWCFLSLLSRGGINQQLIIPRSINLPFPVMKSESPARHQMLQQAEHKLSPTPAFTWHRVATGCQHIKSVCLIANSFLLCLVSLIPPGRFFSLSAIPALLVSISAILFPVLLFCYSLGFLLLLAEIKSLLLLFGDLPLLFSIFPFLCVFGTR